jgi:hypothetical protein
LNAKTGASKLGANLVIGKDKQGNDHAAIVVIGGGAQGNLTQNITLYNNATITIGKKGVLDFDQDADSDTKGGIAVDAMSGNSKIDNYGTINRTVKDGADKMLKIVPPAKGLGTDSMLNIGKKCGIEFVGKYKVEGGGVYIHPDATHYKGIVIDGGMMRILDPGAPGAYLTYADDALVCNSGSISFEHTTSGATTTLVIADAFTMNGGSLSVQLGDAVSVGTSLTETGGSISVMGSGSVVSVTGTYQQTGGTITLGGTGGRLSVNGSLVASGSAVLTLQMGGLLDATTGVTIQSGATLNGYGGFITGNVTNAGTLNLENGGSAYTLSITGDYTQTGTLKVGLASSSSYSRLNVSGRAELGGTLHVDLLGGFTPFPGMGFALLTYGSRLGDFTSYDLPPLGFGHWDHHFDYPTAGIFTLSVIF